MRNANKKIEKRVTEKLNLILSLLAEGPKSTLEIKEATGITYLCHDHMLIFNERMRDANMNQKIKIKRGPNPNNKNGAHCMWWSLVDR